MTAPAIAPAGLLRLDAAVSPDGDGGVLVRVRSAIALGLPLVPYLVVDGGQVEDTTKLSPFPQHGRVAAIAAEHPITGIDATGYRSTSSHGPPYAVGGAPLVGYQDPDATGYLAYRELDYDGYLLRSRWLEPWQVSPVEPGPGVTVVDPEQLRTFLAHPDLALPWHSSGSGDLLKHAELTFAPWRGRLDELLWQHEHPYLPGAVLLEASDQGQGEVQVEFGLWWAAAGVDPAAAALSGAFGLLPLGDDPYFRGLTALTVVAVPPGTGKADEPRAWATAHAYADDDPALQEEIKILLGNAVGPDRLEERLQSVSPELRVIFLATSAISVPLPDLPLPPRVTPAPDEAGATTCGIVVEGHQGGAVAVSRDDGTERRDDVLLLPPSGLVTDAWATTTTPPPAVAYTVRTQDPWGRWGLPAVATCHRPEPDVPQPMAHLEVRPADPSTLPAVAPASPGQVVVRAVVLPPLPGGGEVDAVSATLWWGGVVDLNRIADPTGGPGDWWETTVAADPTTPGGSVDVSVALNAHAGNRTSTPRAVSATVLDPRPPDVLLTSRVLHLAAPAGVDGLAEVDLAVELPPTPAGTTFRLYAADEAALVRGAAPVPVVRRDRVDRLVGLSDRTRYLRLPDDVLRVVPLGGGRRALRVRLTVPGRGTTLRVLQVVAVSPAGVETPAGTAGAFVVGARLVDVPPIPVLLARRTPGVSRSVDVRVAVAAPGGPGFDLRGVRPSAPLPVEVWWAPDSALAGPDRAVPARRLELQSTTGAGAWPYTWSTSATLEVPRGVPPYAPLRLWVRAAWPDESRWHPGTTAAAGPVSAWPPTSTTPDPGPVAVQSAWSPFSSGVRVVPSDDPGAVWCLVSGGASPTITLGWPEFGGHGASWTVRVGAPGIATPVAQVGGEGTLVMTGFSGWPTDRRDWRISVTAPDGTAGPVWNGLAQLLS